MSPKRRKFFLVTSLVTLALVALVWWLRRPKEQEVGQFSYGLAPIFTKGKWGYINEKGKIVISPQFRWAGIFSEGLAVAQIELGNGTAKVGFIDATGKMVIQPRFDEAHGFLEGLSPVMTNRKWGFVDKTGQVVIALRFDRVRGFTEGLAAVAVGEDSGYIDKTGEFVIRPQFASAHAFQEGRALVFTDRILASDTGRTIDFKKAGFIDHSGRFVIPPQYDEAWPFRQGLARIEVDGKHGAIDTTGRLVIEAKYGSLGDFQEGLAYACTFLSFQCGYLNVRGDFVIPPQYASAEPFYQARARVKLADSNSRWATIDRAGNIVKDDGR